MPRPLREPSHALALAVLAALSVPLVFLDLGSYGLVDGDEGFYHAVARRMVESGDVWRLEFAGEHRLYDTFTHAPLFFWLKAGAIAALGDGYWSMRLVSAVFATLAVLATYALACRLVDRRFALLAGVIHWTSFQFVYLHSGRTGEMEPLVPCVTTLTALTFLRAANDGRSFVPHHLLLVAMLTLKAALLLIPLAVEALWFALTPDRRSRLRDWTLHALWVLPLGAAWHVAQLVWHWDGFVETLAKMWVQAGGGALPHAGPLSNTGYYLLTLLWGGFPWSLLYPLGVLALLRRHDATARLVVLYVGVVLTYFALVALRQPWYVGPLYGLLAVGVARWLADRVEAAEPFAGWALPATAACLVTLPGWRVDFDLNPFATRATQLREAVSFGGLLPAEGWPWALLAAAGAALLVHRLRGRRRGALVALAVACLVSVAGLRVALPLRFTDTVTPVERLARDLAARRARGEPIAYPVELANWGELKIRYFFADDYVLEIVSVPGPAGGRRTVHRLVGERAR
ncbi:MAG: ArnT family glycosyltransferase [Myxococcota bacterium]